MPKLQDLNPFAEKEVPLAGKRISVIQQENITSDLAAASRPIILPQPQANETWSQPGGIATNAPGHLALERQRQIGVERQCRHRLQLLRQADGQPDRLRRPGVHARRGGQGDGRQRFGRRGCVEGVDHAAQREGPGRLRRRPGGRRRAHLRGNRLRRRGGARCQGRQEAVGEESGLAVARLADGCGRARFRGHEGGAGVSASPAPTAPSFGISRASPSAPAFWSTPAPRSTATRWSCPIRPATWSRFACRPVSRSGRNRWRARARHPLWAP